MIDADTELLLEDTGVSAGSASLSPSPCFADADKARMKTAMKVAARI